MLTPPLLHFRGAAVSLLELVLVWADLLCAGIRIAVK